MKNILIYLGIFGLMYACTPTFAQQYIQKQESQIINVLANAGFESGKANWPQTTPSTVTVVSGTSALFGGGSVKFEATSGTQTISSGLYTVPSGLKGKECHAVVNYSTNDTTSIPYIAKVIDASGTVLSTKNLDAKIVSGVPTTLPTSVTVDGWNCPTDKQVKLDIVPTAVGPWVILDNMHLGSKTGGLGNAADIANALGYVPADDADLQAVSGTVNSVSATVSALDAATLKKSANLSDVASATVSRNNLGLGSLATKSQVDLGTSDVSGTLTTDKGGTGNTSFVTGLMYASGSTITSFGNGTAGQALIVSGTTGSPYWSTVTATPSYILQSVTSTTTLTTSTHVFANATNGPYTITLPSASSTGVLLTIQKTDTVSHVITLSTQFGQTIDASSTSRLNTVNETLNLISSGTTWTVLSRDTRTTIISSGTITITATTTNPTKGAGDYDNIYIERSSGTLAFLKMKYRQGVAGSSGTGDYLFTLPFGLRFDPNKTYFSTSTNVFDTILQGATGSAIGTIANGSSSGPCYGVAYDATRFRMACSVNYTNYGWFGSGLYGLGGGSIGFSLNMLFDVENWLP